MGIFNQSAAQKEVEVVKDFNYYNERGFTIIAFNIGADERFYDPSKRANRQEEWATPITSNKGRISCAKNGSVFFTGTIAGFYQWSPTRKQFVSPPAVRKDDRTKLDTTDPDAKPTGFVGLYMMAAVNCAKSAMELFLEDGEIELAEKAEVATKKAKNLNFLVNQEIAFDLPLHHDVVVKQSQVLRNKRLSASKHGRTAGSLQATLVLAVKIAFPKAGILQPIIKVHEILSWEGEYMPLPIAGRLELTPDQADSLMLEAESLWDEQAANSSLEKSMGQAAINLLVGDGTGVGTTRTRNNSERRDRYRKEKAKKEAQQAAFSEPQADIEEISEEDLDSLGSLGI